MIVITVAIVGGLAFLAAAAVLGISAWVAYYWTRVERVPVHDHPSSYGLVYEDVQFPSRKDCVSLRGWYLPARPNERCIILVQGEGHHRNSPGIRALELGRDLVASGFSVLLFDFRGRGESGGSQSSAGDREQWDVLGAIDYVSSRSIPPGRIGLVGFSLGAAVVILVAAREPRIPAIVADSAFTDSFADLAWLPIRLMRTASLPRWFAYIISLMGSTFFQANFGNVRPAKVVHQIAPRPVYFIHGAEDEIVPSQESIDLHLSSGIETNPIWIVPGAGHVGSYASQPQEYAARVGEFFKRYIPRPAGNEPPAPT